jgi:hypothetical protein
MTEIERKIIVFNIQLVKTKEKMTFKHKLLDKSLKRLTDINALLHKICCEFEKSQIMKFQIDGFGQNSWTVDIATDFVIFLEQLPNFTRWLMNQPSELFELSFYEQGLERNLIFQFQKQDCIIKCQSWGRWQPTFEVENISYKELKQMIKILVFQFIRAVQDNFPETYQNNSFQVWKGKVFIKT